MEIFLTTAMVLAFITTCYYTFREKRYKEDELVAFGNYLLSKERHNRIKMCKNLPNKEVWEERLAQVSDADLRNWMELENHI